MSALAALGCARPPAPAAPPGLPVPTAAKADAASADDGTGAALPVDDPRGAPLAAMGTLTLAERPQGPRLRVELAMTEAERSRGLMFRRRLEPHAGMLFFMGDDRPWQFWMRNTWISLDMIFIDAEWNVVGVVAAVPPLTEASRGVERPSRYVLELAAHEAARLGIGVGARLIFAADPGVALPTRTP